MACAQDVVADGAGVETDTFTLGNLLTKNVPSLFDLTLILEFRSAFPN
jgi:hypothetical protein